MEKITDKSSKNNSSNKFYFTQQTEDAIIEYNNECDEARRSQIYNDRIKQPFDKLVENMIHTFKFYCFDSNYSEVKAEVVAFLVMNMGKFRSGKGKAFSYFSIVAKNYLILHNNNNFKRLKAKDDVDVIDQDRNFDSEERFSDRKDDDNEFIDQMLCFWENNLTEVFVRSKDIMVADAVLELFRKRSHIENFNKKALYIFIREMTGVKTQYITKVVNVMRDHYVRMKGEYQNVDRVTTKFTGSLF